MSAHIYNAYMRIWRCESGQAVSIQRHGRRHLALLRGAPGALRAYCGQLIKSIQIVLVQCARLMQGAAEQFNNIKLFI